MVKKHPLRSTPTVYVVCSASHDKIFVNSLLEVEKLVADVTQVLQTHVDEALDVALADLDVERHLVLHLVHF